MCINGISLCFGHGKPKCIKFRVVHDNGRTFGGLNVLNLDVPDDHLQRDLVVF